MKKKKNVDKKKQFIMIGGMILAVNLLVIIIVVLVFMKGSSNKTEVESEWQVNTPTVKETVEEITVEQPEEEVVEEEIDDSMFKEEERVLTEDENYIEIYKSIIIGSYSTEDGKTFCFNFDDTFEGYYNEENPNVSRYNFAVVGTITEGFKIRISNPTFTESVEYNIDVLTNGQIRMHLSEESYIDLGY